jgi:hypothetical protein
LTSWLLVFQEVEDEDEMFLEMMKREGLFLHVFKRRRMCVCARE